MSTAVEFLNGMSASAPNWQELTMMCIATLALSVEIVRAKHEHASAVRVRLDAHLTPIKAGHFDELLILFAADGIDLANWLARCGEHSAKLQGLLEILIAAAHVSNSASLWEELLGHPRYRRCAQVCDRLPVNLAIAKVAPAYAVQLGVPCDGARPACFRGVFRALSRRPID